MLFVSNPYKMVGMFLVFPWHAKGKTGLLQEHAALRGNDHTMSQEPAEFLMARG